MLCFIMSRKNSYQPKANMMWNADYIRDKGHLIIWEKLCLFSCCLSWKYVRQTPILLFSNILSLSCFPLPTDFKHSHTTYETINCFYYGKTTCALQNFHISSPIFARPHKILSQTEAKKKLGVANCTWLKRCNKVLQTM